MDLYASGIDNAIAVPVAEDGRILSECHTGCENEDIGAGVER